jgi:hypothetical protein
LNDQRDRTLLIAAIDEYYTRVRSVPVTKLALVDQEALEQAEPTDKNWEAALTQFAHELCNVL